jgi:hypothetical protein
MHAVADVQDTPERPASCDPLGIEMGSIVQVVPFQASTSVPPEAMHAVAAVQDTSKRLTCDPGGFGVGSTVQVVPFQTSANVSSVRPLGL